MRIILAKPIRFLVLYAPVWVWRSCRQPPGSHLEHLQFRPLADAKPRAELYMVSRVDSDNPALPSSLALASDYFDGFPLERRLAVDQLHEKYPGSQRTQTAED